MPERARTGRALSRYRLCPPLSSPGRTEASVAGARWTPPRRASGETGCAWGKGRLAEGGEQPRQGGAHQVGQGRRQHRLEAEARHVVAALRRHGADGAKLHRNGAQVGKTAQREGDDDLGVGAEILLDVGKVQVGDELVHDHLLANQGACRHHLAGRHADEPGHRRKQIAQQLLQGEIGPAKPLAHRGETGVCLLYTSPSPRD